MFDLALKIFLFLSPVLFLPLNFPHLASLQFYQFGYFGKSINLVQLQLFEYGVIALVITALFNNPKRFFQDNYLKFVLIIYCMSIFIHPKTIKTFPVIFLGFLLYYLVSVCANVKNLKPIFLVIISVSGTTFLHSSAIKP